MSKTLIIGSMTVDIVIPTPKLPTSTEDINSRAHLFSLGGCAYNVSQVFHLLKLPYLHATTIGSGIYGDYVLKEAKERNIPIFRTSNEQHGACLCLVEDNGERSFIAYHGIEYKFDRKWFEDVDVSEFNQCFICGLEIEEDTGEEIVAFLEENAIKDIYFGPGPRLMTIRTDLLNRLLALHPIIHLNEQELLEYTKGESIEEGLKKLHSETANDVIVTLGSKGSIVYTGEEIINAESIPVKATDTVGAGDNHLGTYMAARAMGRSKEEALKMANLFAATVVTHPGPTLRIEDIEQYL